MVSNFPLRLVLEGKDLVTKPRVFAANLLRIIVAEAEAVTLVFVEDVLRGPYCTSIFRVEKLDWRR